MRVELPTALMRVSLVVAFVMLAGKLTAYFITGSTAILSDAAESVIHLAATSVATFSLWYSKQPPDRGHLYGHGKIAYFSAGLEGGLIFLAAVYIIWEAVLALIVGPDLQRLGLGLLITATLAVINLILGLALVRVGSQHNSVVVVANGKHVLTDMWTSLAVVVGVGIVWATDLVWLDPLIAMAAALNIMVSALRLARGAYGGLLDEADPAVTHRIVDCLEGAKRNGIILDFHQLRHRESDAVLWIELHMLLPADMPVQEAHRRVTGVERTVAALFPRQKVHLTTHIEPLGLHRDHHPGGHPELPDPVDAPTTRP